MRKTQTSSSVEREYNRRACGAVIAYLPKDTAEAFKRKCADSGTSQASVIRAAVEKFLSDDESIYELNQKRERSCAAFLFFAHFLTGEVKQRTKITEAISGLTGNGFLFVLSTSAGCFTEQPPDT